MIREAQDTTVVLNRQGEGAAPRGPLTDFATPRFEQLEERMVHAARMRPVLARALAGEAPLVLYVPHEQLGEYQALLAEGGLPEDPAAYVKRVNALLA